MATKNPSNSASPTPGKSIKTKTRNKAGLKIAPVGPIG